MLRKLRIAFSAGCGIVCVLLIVLWVRSYWRSDLIEGNGVGKRHYIQIGSHGGFLGVDYHYSYFRFDGNHNWRITSKPVHNVNAAMTPWYGKILHDHNRTVTIAPYWIALLVFFALSVFPWLKRMTRFSLRTLLIATTLVAIMLGAVIFAAR